MTQEELDALMNSDLDLDEAEAQEASKKSDEDEVVHHLEESYAVHSDNAWPPPPPNREHQVVTQLDDVTRESEEKATEIFDILDGISNNANDVADTLNDVAKSVTTAREVFGKLREKFPNIEAFGENYDALEKVLETLENANNSLMQVGDDTLMAMDIMQYQDIHRQKIERVINIMRSLSRYLNQLFEAQVDDSKRVSSAKHIVGDSTEEVVADDDIEALIAAFGQK